MKITLLSKFEYTSLVLPEKPVGHFWVKARSDAHKLINVVSIEAVSRYDSQQSGLWIMKSNKRYKVLDQEGKTVNDVQLKPQQFYKIQSSDEAQSFILFTEVLSIDRKQHVGYEITQSEITLTIGREPVNDIVYANGYVSGTHAVLTIKDGLMHISDNKSANYTYVNGKCIESCALNIGDVIYILGLQIVLTPKYLFINNPDGQVTIRNAALKAYRSKLGAKAVIDDQSTVSMEYESLDETDFIKPTYHYRAPRFKYDVEGFSLKIDAPPSNQLGDDVPMIMLIGPALTMGMASVASGVFSVVNALERGNINAAIPSIVMSISMLLGTLMWPLLTKSYQKKMRSQKEAKRQEAYTAYLKNLQKLVEEEVARQEAILRANDVDPKTLAMRMLVDNPKLWERTPKHSDFLSLRVGYGEIPLISDIQYSERKFSVEQDNLTEMMYAFGEAKRNLSDVPITLSLLERYISGIYANKAHIASFAKNIILQLVTLHSYDELKLVLIFDESSSEDYAFSKWLPHAMSNDKAQIYVATNYEEAKELSASIDPIVEYRKGISAHQLEDEVPHYVILCLDKELSVKTECVRRVLEHKTFIKFSVVSLFENLVDLPKECSAVIGLSEEKVGTLTLIDDVSEPPLNFSLDDTHHIDFKKVTATLANTFIDLGDLQFQLPSKYTFFQMLEIGLVEHLNLVENWKINDPTKSLATCVGVDKYGDAFKIDLHEKAHGPHGLVAGMTGSGKSEFIIAYILSMAVSFHPYEVAFILIDYKGGGMADAFKSIPHTAGIITNLDGNGIKRSLSSMRSELHRRERIFKEVSQKYNISNIDIYKYQKLFREGRVLEPLPHLFIISDEFAELKKEQPDFMTELTSTARVGRSLGVHLILATQKPGGVVDDQIRSNSRFRVCLKVQDLGDSTEMLGRPEAASLVNTGRFYLQVGNNEIFQIGQSAWAGAAYYPSLKVVKDRDDAVSVVNTNGRLIAEANVDRFAMFKDPKKQIDVLTEYIDKVSSEIHVKRWKMWLDPLPAQIFLEQLCEKYPTADTPSIINPVIGEYDDPAHQSQAVLRVPVTKEGNTLIYGSAGSGKVMFLEAMCYSIISQHTPKEVNMYLLDFGAQTLTAFSEAPHVGDVILSHEGEKINNLFKVLFGKLETRKQMFAPFGGSMTLYNQQSNQPEAQIVVVLNNFAVFSELYEDHIGDLVFLSREGTKYGIYFVLTSTTVNGVRPNLLQNYKMLFCLQLNNPEDYSIVVGKTEGLTPEAYTGRGIYRRDKDSVLEFQVASLSKETNTFTYLKDFSRDIARRFTTEEAMRIPVLPERVTEALIAKTAHQGDLSQVPIGIVKSNLQVYSYDFTAQVVNLILASDREWSAFSAAIAKLVARHCKVKTLLFAPLGQALPASDDSLTVMCDLDACVAGIDSLFSTVLTRNNAYKDKLSAGEAAPAFDTLFVVIQSMATLKSLLDGYQPKTAAEKMADDDTPIYRLSLAMAKCVKAYNVHFTIAESLNGVSPLTAENWYKTHITGNSGIWVGSGINGQYRLNVTRKPQEFMSEVTSDFGFAVDKGHATFIKLLHNQEAVEVL